MLGLWLFYGCYSSFIVDMIEESIIGTKDCFVIDDNDRCIMAEVHVSPAFPAAGNGVMQGHTGREGNIPCSENVSGTRFW